MCSVKKVLMRKIEIFARSLSKIYLFSANLKILKIVALIDLNSNKAVLFVKNAQSRIVIVKENKFLQIRINLLEMNHIKFSLRLLKKKEKLNIIDFYYLN